MNLVSHWLQIVNILFENDRIVIFSHIYLTLKPFFMWVCDLVFKMLFYNLQSNPPPKSRTYSMASQGSGSSPMSMRRPSQNPTLFGWSQVHKGSSLYSSKRSLLPDSLMDAREVKPAGMTQAGLLRSVHVAERKIFFAHNLQLSHR